MADLVIGGTTVAASDFVFDVTVLAADRLLGDVLARLSQFGLCSPTFADLAALTGDKPKTLEDRTKRLRQSGWLMVTSERKHDPATGRFSTINTYDCGGIIAGHRPGLAAPRPCPDRDMDRPCPDRAFVTDTDRENYSTETERENSLSSVSVQIGPDAVGPGRQTAHLPIWGYAAPDDPKRIRSEIDEQVTLACGGQIPNRKTVEELIEKFGADQTWRQAMMLRARLDQSVQPIKDPTRLWVSSVRANYSAPKWPCVRSASDIFADELRADRASESADDDDSIPF